MSGLDYTKKDIDPFWQKVIDDIKDSLIASGHNASGNTLQAIEAPRITVGKNSYKVELIMPDYYSFLDEGVRGTGKFGKNAKNPFMRINTGKFSFKDKGKGRGGKGQRGLPPIASIRSHMANRGIQARDGLDNTAWAISYSIWQKGLEQTNFYSNVVNQKLLDNYADLILEQLGKKVIVTFDKF